nr:DUF255 domain-containing protein [Glycomyces salinus]
MNELAEALSPYLRQHAENPVAWRQWSPEALAEAERRDVPLVGETAVPPPGRS